MTTSTSPTPAPEREIRYATKHILPAPHLHKRKMENTYFAHLFFLTKCLFCVLFIH